MALCGEVVDLVGLELVEELHEGHGVGEVSVVEVESGIVSGPETREVVDARPVDAAGAADDTVYLVTLFEEEFGEV
jgi:hypothetical protein